MNTAWRTLIDRLAEPSTYAGVGLITGAFGLPADKVDAITRVLMAIAGLAAMFLGERKQRPLPAHLRDLEEGDDGH